ncbi:uncharacterized protein LOC143462829 [Clavelina lepadiformis]|uniref:uncharacterized protein LOC143462829 n=1 Tax=Clavelina lepadiformis TaxID=159417 RepID=UPI004041B91E
MATQVQHVTVATVQPQQVVFKNLKPIFILGIIETILGLLIAILGAVVIASYSPRNTINAGEGLWCGIWVIIAGILGIFAGRNRTTLSLVNAHMGLSITATVFSGILVCIDSWLAYVLGLYIPGSTPHGLFSCLAIFGFISFILLITSSALCCSASPYTCCGSCCGAPVSAPPPQTMHVVTQQPAVVYQTPGAPQTVAYPAQQQPYDQKAAGMPPPAGVVAGVPPPYSG